MNNTDQNRRRLLLGIGLMAFVALLLIAPFVVTSAGDPTTTVDTIPTAAACAQGEPVFQRYSLPPGDNRFGEGMNLDDPASDLNGDGVVDVHDVRLKLHQVRCENPAIMAAHATYTGERPVDTAAIMALTQSYIADRTTWSDSVALLELAESKCTASIEDMSGPYQTMDMTDTHPIPEVHQVDPDVPHYAVLRFTCPDGKTWNYKINCLFQPVAQFPPVAPPPTQPNTPPCGNCGPPATQPPPTCTNCRPTTTSPPPTTPPTTSGCPTGPNGCKKNVPWSPGQCSQPDQNCQPGVGPSVPRPADPVEPTPTVAPPSSVPPPTNAPPPPSQPPQGPVTTIVTAPA